MDGNSENGDVGVRRIRAVRRSSRDVGGPETPFDDAAILQLFADLLSEEHAIESTSVADPADLQIPPHGVP
jgi:hypothetical protein